MLRLSAFVSLCSTANPCDMNHKFDPNIYIKKQINTFDYICPCDESAEHFFKFKYADQSVHGCCKIGGAIAEIIIMVLKVSWLSKHK